MIFFVEIFGSEISMEIVEVFFSMIILLGVCKIILIVIDEFRGFFLLRGSEWVGDVVLNMLIGVNECIYLIV